MLSLRRVVSEVCLDWVQSTRRVEMKKKLSVVGLCILGFAYSFATQAATLQDLSSEDLNQQIHGLAGSD